MFQNRPEAGVCGGDSRAGALLQLHADARLHQIDRAQADEKRDRRDDLEVQDGLAADAAHGFDVACSGDAVDQRGKEQGRDDGLNQPEKNGSENAALFGGSGRSAPNAMPATSAVRIQVVRLSRFIVCFCVWFPFPVHVLATADGAAVFKKCPAFAVAPSSGCEQRGRPSLLKDAESGRERIGPMAYRTPASRPVGITVSTILLHLLNLLTYIFIRWGEADSLVIAMLIIVYIVFTALVIHAFWLGQRWARWMILVRCGVILATFKMLYLEGGLHRVQGIAERVLALVLLVYLNTPGVRRWFRSGSEAQRSSYN